MNIIDNHKNTSVKKKKTNIKGRERKTQNTTKRKYENNVTLFCYKLNFNFN